jgi:hypothetical protein
VTCGECGHAHSVPLDALCPNCGEEVGVSCRDCGNLFDIGDLDHERRCEEQCAPDWAKFQAQEKRRLIEEGRGDWLRDQQKDAR